MATKKSTAKYDRRPSKAEVIRAREYMAGPKGPGNYKDVDVLAAEIAAALKAKSQLLADFPHLGRAIGRRRLRGTAARAGRVTRSVRLSACGRSSESWPARHRV